MQFSMSIHLNAILTTELRPNQEPNVFWKFVECVPYLFELRHPYFNPVAHVWKEKTNNFTLIEHTYFCGGNPPNALSETLVHLYRNFGHTWLSMDCNFHWIVIYVPTPDHGCVTSMIGWNWLSQTKVMTLMKSYIFVTYQSISSMKTFGWQKCVKMLSVLGSLVHNSYPLHVPNYFDYLQRQ